MDQAKLKIAQAACRAYTNDALARQLELMWDRGQSPEWKLAVSQEAAVRILNPGRYFGKQGVARVVYECPSCPGSETHPGKCPTRGCGRSLVAREIPARRSRKKADA